jgi:nucleotide-binding universal stress UspA family protein
MKHLLVAFDFSRNAHKALDFALLFANKTGADLSLVWVDSTSTPDNELSIEQELRIETKKYFDDILNQYQPRLTKGKLDVILRKGKVYNEVAMAARKVEADVVFAGTHGVSGFEQYWIGSNAYRIVTSSPCPVITIRSDYAIKKDIKRIILPLDSTAETGQKLPFACKLAAYFKAEIHLLALYNTNLTAIRHRIKSHADKAATCFDEQGIKHVIKEIEADKIVNSVLDYASEVDADMISIMTEQTTTTASMFLGPYAQQLINYSLIPVLCLQSK